MLNHPPYTEQRSDGHQHKKVSRNLIPILLHGSHVSKYNSHFSCGLWNGRNIWCSHLLSTSEPCFSASSRLLPLQSIDSYPLLACPCPLLLPLPFLFGNFMEAWPNYKILWSWIPTLTSRIDEQSHEFMGYNSEIWHHGLKKFLKKGKNTHESD